jgi:hypothetical protein
VQGGIERALVHAEHVARNLLDALRDAPAVLGARQQGAQDQEIERPLQ